MSPDDPRHGTTRGFHAGCRDACCRRARARYEKEGRLARLSGGRAIPSLGAQRRIQALMVLGWTSEDIRIEAGWGHRNAVLSILNGQNGRACTWIERKTDAKIREVYERLSMRLPEPSGYRRRGATIARRKGWAPPLAWDNIDDPDERPARPEVSDGRKTVHLVIEDAEWLADGDANLQEVCDRLGVNRDTFRDLLRREGRTDLYWRLANREPDADLRRATRDGIKRSREVA